MTEAELQAAVEAACAWLGLHVYHTHDSRRSQPGFPDLVIAGPGGILFAELKSATGRLTLPQQGWLAVLQAAGADTAVWRPAQWPEPAMTRLRELQRPDHELRPRRRALRPAA